MDNKQGGVKFTHLLIASLPMLATPVLVFAIAEGWLNFGGGEKDLLLTIPYVFWASVFFVTAFVLIVKKWSLQKWFLRSVGISIGMLIAVWLFLLVAGQSGMAYSQPP